MTVIVQNQNDVVILADSKKNYVAALKGTVIISNNATGNVTVNLTFNEANGFTGNISNGNLTINLQDANATQSGKMTASSFQHLTGATTNISTLQDATNTINQTLTDHLGNHTNPHNVTKAQIGLGNVSDITPLNLPISTATQSALDLKLNISEKGASNGIAELVNGTIPSNQLPSFVDDIVEYDNLSLFPVSGESGKLYVAKDSNLIYRWTGSIYVEVSAGSGGLVLGETAATAYRGDRGATAYNHSQTTHDKAFVGLGNVDNTSDADKPISTATQTALNGKVNTSLTINGQALTGNVNLTTNNITPTTNKNYVTDEKLAVLNQTTGTNSGDQDLSGYVPTSRTINGVNLTGNITLNTSSISDSTDKRYVNDSQLTTINNSGNHAAITNLNWTSSGHIGTGSTVAGFNSTGATQFLTVNGSGSVVLSSDASVTNLNLTTPILGKPQSGDLENCVLDCKNGFRLTLTSATPVTTSDVTSSTIYATPYVSDLMSLYVGGKWVTRRYSEVSIALSGLTTNSVYDVFAYDNSGTLTLELLVWTNATTRATAITRLNGVWTKSGDSTRRLLGTFKATSATQTIDSAKQRLLCNVDNLIRRSLQYFIPETVWQATNTGGLYGDSNWGLANTGVTQNNYLEIVLSTNEQMVTVATSGLVAIPNANYLAEYQCTFGVDSITTRSAYASIGCALLASNNACVEARAELCGAIGLGARKIYLLDRFTNNFALAQGTSGNRQPMIAGMVML